MTWVGAGLIRQMRTSAGAMGLLGTPLTMLLASCIPPVSAASPPATPAPVSVPAASAAAIPAPSVVQPAIHLDAGPIQQGDLVRGRIEPTGATLLFNGQPLMVAADGQFIIGFDRDAGPTATLELRDRGVAVARTDLAVAPGNWSIQHVNAPMRGAARSDAEFERRRPAELAQMAAARQTVVTSDGWRQQFIWPVTGRVSGVFGSQRIYQGTPGSFHNGVDVAVPTGTTLRAPADGVVILAATEPFTLEGYLLMIDHGHGLSSVFLHNSRLDVRTGDVVRQGQILGATGMTGRATGPHMHWAMRWNGQKIDAQRMAGPM